MPEIDKDRLERIDGVESEGNNGIFSEVGRCAEYQMTTII